MKNLIKKYFQILWQRHKFSPAVQIQQRQLFLQYQQWIQEGKKIDLKDTGFRNFSQFEEDGLLLFIFATIGMTCLLYTSPSPRDQRGSRMPSSA